MVSVTVSILLTLVVLFLINFRKNIANYWEFRKKVYKLPQTDNHFLFGHIWHILGSRAKIPDVIREKIAIYPPFFVVWLGPIAACTTLDPKHIEVILGNSQYIDKPFIYTFLHPWLGTGLLTSTGAKWHSHRKFLTPAFHFSILETFLEVFAEKSTILVKVLRKEIGSKKFDINPYISKCTLDIICETAMGVEMNSQEETEESEYVNTVNRMTEEVNKRFLAPWLYPDFIYYLSPPGRRFKKYVKILHNYSNKVIRERKEHNKRIKVGEKNDQDSYLGKKKKMAFLDLLLQSSEQGGNLTDEEIREEVDTFMFEGHDTTSAAVCWLLSCLSTSYEVQEKVFEEQESIFKGSDRSPTMKDLNEMKYLERVIKESLRLFPSVPLFGRLLKQDVQMDGYTLPKGLVIGLLVPSIHRNPEYFPNPEEFNPDNFLPERVAARHPYAYIPFSAGPRNCIGQKFALLEEKMEISSILMASVVLVLLLIYWRGIINYFKFWRKVKRLPQIKSHFLFGVIWELMVPRNKLVERATALFSRSPALFATWVGPLAAFGVTRAKHLEVILGSAKHIDKAKIYEFLEPWLNTGILTSSGSKWHSRRKMITPAFHFSILENFIGVFAEKSQILIEKLKKEVESKKFDVTPYITLCTLDVICETSMGVKINAQGVGEESEYVKAVCSITEEGMTRFLSPWLYPDFLFYLSPPGRRFKTYLKTLHNFSNKVIRQRREEYSRTAKNYNFSEDYYAGKKNKLTFLDLLLEYSENEYGLTDEDIREEVDTIMFEGHDTITSAICWSLQMLASHKDVQSKVQQEIENIFQGSDRPANSKDLNEMKYLERVIKETLRLYPSVPLIGRTLNVDLQLDGNIVPAGMMLGFPIFYIHRDPEQFPDPDKFDPDHFLPERVVARHPYAYVPFSAGPRNCIGQKFAMLEMKVVLSSILRHYDLHATGPVPTSLIRVLLKPENGVQLRITPRSSLT